MIQPLFVSLSLKVRVSKTNLESTLQSIPYFFP